MQASLNTLKKNREFAYVYRRGKAVHGRYFTMIYVKSRYGGVRAGFSVSKKVGNSVQRNRARRRLKEAFLKVLPEIRGHYSIVFVARQSIHEADFHRGLVRGIQGSLKKAQIAFGGTDEKDRVGVD